jgi:hypothetical protein
MLVNSMNASLWQASIAFARLHSAGWPRLAFDPYGFVFNSPAKTMEGT